MGLSADEELALKSEAVEGRGSGAFQLLNLIIRHRRMILLTGVIVGLATGVKSILKPRTYTTSTAFVPQSSTGQPANAAGLAATFGITIGGSSGQTDSPQFYADMLSTDEILRPVVTATYSDPLFEGGRPLPLAKILKADDASPELAISQLEKAMRGMMDVEVNIRTGVVGVTLTSSYPTLAKQLSDSLLASLNAFNLAGRHSRAASDREFAGERLESYQADLAASERAYEDFLASNRVMMSPALQLQRDRLQRRIAMIQQVVTSLTSTYEQAKIDEVRSTPAIRVLQRPRVPVEPNARGTIKKVLLGGMVGSMLALAIAIFAERLRYSRDMGDPALAEFLSNIRSVFTRRRRKSA